MKKKIISALLCAAMATSMLAGCGSQEAGSASNDTANDAASSDTAASDDAAGDVAAGEPAAKTRAAVQGGKYPDRLHKKNKRL